MQGDEFFYSRAKKSIKEAVKGQERGLLSLTPSWCGWGPGL